MQVWDTAGQERFRTITQSYYRSAHGAMIAYDITRQETFDSVRHWIQEVETYGATNIVLVLIGGSSYNLSGKSNLPVYFFDFKAASPTCACLQPRIATSRKMQLGATKRKAYSFSTKSFECIHLFFL